MGNLYRANTPDALQTALDQWLRWDHTCELLLINDTSMFSQTFREFQELNKTEITNKLQDFLTRNESTCCKETTQEERDRAINNALLIEKIAEILDYPIELNTDNEAYYQECCGELKIYPETASIMEDDAIVIEAVYYRLDGSRISLAVNAANITWYNDNEDVISLSASGEKASITALKEGTATIRLEMLTSNLQCSCDNYIKKSTFSIEIKKGPLAPPAGISFTDEDNDKNQIAGTLVITRADDESGIDSYVLYRSVDGKTPSEKTGELEVTGSDIQYRVAENTPYDKDLPFYIAFSKNEQGTNNRPVSIEIIDKGGPELIDIYPVDGEINVTMSRSIELYFDRDLLETAFGEVRLGDTTYGNGTNCQMEIMHNYVIIKPSGSFKSNTKYEGIEISGFKERETRSEMSQFTKSSYDFKTEEPVYYLEFDFMAPEASSSHFFQCGPDDTSIEPSAKINDYGGEASTGGVAFNCESDGGLYFEFSFDGTGAGTYTDEECFMNFMISTGIYYTSYTMYIPQPRDMIIDVIQFDQEDGGVIEGNFGGTLYYSNDESIPGTVENGHFILKHDQNLNW